MNARRDQVRGRLAELGCDAILVTKAVNVRYLTGFSGSNGQLIVGSDDAFLTDPRYEEQSAKESPDVERVIYRKHEDGSGGFHGYLADTLRARSIERLGVEAAHMTLQTAGDLREKLEGVTLIETTDVVEPLRRIKDADEVEALRTACSFADRALQELLGSLAEGMTEVEVAAFLEDAMRRAGSEGLSFDTIAAFGEQAAEPHHSPTERTLKPGDMVKLDFGATYRGYHSDMTRTIAFGTPTDDMLAVYELVRGSQQAGLDAVKAGVTAGDVDRAARGYLTERGYDFGHGTGHGVGLEVHEAPSVWGGADDVLEPGMCITVEPGIYLPGVGGVRIEDSVVVTADGCDILTASPKELIKV